CKLVVRAQKFEHRRAAEDQIWFISHKSGRHRRPQQGGKQQQKQGFRPRIVRPYGLQNHGNLRWKAATMWVHNGAVGRPSVEGCPLTRCEAFLLRFGRKPQESEAVRWLTRFASAKLKKTE